jgi:hypothetical protein
MTLILMDPFRIPAGGGPVYDPDVQAWMNNRSVLGDPVPTAYANAVNQYVLDLKAIPGHWDTIAQLNVYAGATTVAGALAAIKGPSQTHVNLLPGDLNLRTGVRGNLTNKHIVTGYTGTSFPQNSVHAYCLITEAATGTSATLFGNGSNATGAMNMVWNLNSRNRNATADAFSSTGLGGYGMSRSNASDYRRMLADSVSTVTRGSQAPSTRPIFVLARSAAASNAPEFWGDARTLVWAIGTAATLENYTAPGNALRTALNAI